MSKKKKVKRKPLEQNGKRIFLREWRKVRDFSQAELADKMNIARRETISDLELGVYRHRRNGMGYLHLAAKALGLESVERLYDNPFREIK